MPVFEPNEYFWSNFWVEGKEQKWEAYARACKEIIADVGGIKISNATIQDKLTYKYMIRGKKPRVKKD